MSEAETDVSSDDHSKETMSWQNDTEDASHSLTKKILDPDHPMMTRFQNALKQLLVKQKDDLKQEVFNLEREIVFKKNDKASVEKEKSNTADRLTAQQNTLKKLHSTRTKILSNIKKNLEKAINDHKQRYHEIITNISIEEEKISTIKRKLAYSQSFLKNLSIYENEQTMNFKKFESRKSRTKQLKKIYLNNQQQKNLLCSSLTQEIGRLEDRIKHLKEAADTRYNESELLKQKLMDVSTDLDTTNRENTKLTSLWNTVLFSIKQRHENTQRMKIDYQKVKAKHQTLLADKNSFKLSVQKESERNEDLRNSSDKLKLKQSHLQNTYDTFLDKIDRSKNEYSKLLQITEFEHLNLNQVLLDQKTVNDEIQTLVNLLDEKSHLKLKYEEDVLSELKKQLLSSQKSAQINNKISALTIQNKDKKLMLVGYEKIFGQAMLKLEQYRATSSNIIHDIDKSTKCLNSQEFILSTLNYELKKLDLDIRNKSDSIHLQDKKLTSLKIKEEEGLNIIDDVQYKIDVVQKETELIKQSWIQSQNQNVQLMNKRDKQYNELKKNREIASVMDAKNTILNSEIATLSKQVNQHERTLDYMRRNLTKLNEDVYKKEGKSSQLLNENEWLQHSYIAELKENEKQCLEHIQQLKLAKNELNEMKNVYAEKQRESYSWETKVQSLVKIKKEMKSKDGDFGDIEAKKKEIHRMEIREKHLQKRTKQIIKDLELSLSTHVTIYNKAASKVISLKAGKNPKQSFLKKLENLRTIIKKKETECKQLDRCLNSLQHNKIELECKLTNLSDKINDIQRDNNHLTATIEDLGVTKIKNVYELCYKQSHAKFLDEVNNDKYRLLIKNESKMNDALAAELKINSDLVSIVEALKNDFPNLNDQITRILCLLKSTGSS